MRALPLIAGLMAFSSPAWAMDTDEIAALFIDACMGAGPHDQTLENLGQSRGWLKAHTSDAQSPLPSQAIVGSRWTVPANGRRTMSPDIQVAEMRVFDKPEASHGSARMCTVTDQGDPLDRISEQLQTLLHLSPPTRRMPEADGYTTQWVLNDNPLDAVSLTQSSKPSGPVTTIVRAQTPAQEKR